MIGEQDKGEKYLSRNFQAKEFACYCGCGFGLNDGDVSELAVAKLQTLRDIIQKKTGVEVPLRITPKGGCRCPEANRKAGGAMPDSRTGAPGSAHLRGAGFDILPVWGWPKTYNVTGLTRLDIVKLAEDVFAEGGVGSNRYGADGIIHIDYDPILIEWKRFRRW